MKKHLLTLAFSLLFIGASVADTTPSTIATAREIANALQLNEAQYLKIKNLINARMEEVKGGKTEASAIDEKFTSALLQVLNAEQLKAYQAYAQTHALPQIAQVK